MKKIIALAALSIVLLCSCRATHDAEKVQASYSAIESALQSSMPFRRALINKMTNSIISLQADNNAIVDTAKLWLLLDSTRTTCNASIKIITQVDEIDDELKYKEQAIHYLLLVERLCDEQFTKAVHMLASGSEDKFNSIRAFISPGVREMVDESMKTEKLSGKVKTKYGITTSTTQDSPGFVK